MAKFDELLEKTYNTLGETSLTTGGARGSQMAGTTSDADKLAAVVAAADDEHASDRDKKKLAKIGKEVDATNVKV